VASYFTEEVECGPISLHPVPRYVQIDFVCAMRQSAMNFQVDRIASAKTFLDHSESFRNANPIETNVISSIAISTESSTKTDPASFWWIVRHDGEAVGIATRTTPHRLNLSPMPDGSAGELARVILASDPMCWGVTGPEEIASAFVKHWCALTGKSRTDFPLHERQTLYVLGEHTPFTSVPGNARQSNVDDLSLLVKWMRAFVKETGGIMVASEADLQARVLASTFIIWEIDGTPVAMSRLASTIAQPEGMIGRIGVVYTTPDKRGNGYGAAVTSAMIKHLIAVGCSTITLHTDGDYEKSNRVYQKLGFLPVGAFVELGVEPRAI
jgi:predicted GNAT family acetyltransferase